MDGTEHWRHDVEPMGQPIPLGSYEVGRVTCLEFQLEDGRLHFDFYWDMDEGWGAGLDIDLLKDSSILAKEIARVVNQAWEQGKLAGRNGLRRDLQDLMRIQPVGKL